METKIKRWRRWRDLGGHLRARFRLDKNGQLDLVAVIGHQQEISKLCKELEKQLSREFEVYQKCSNSSFLQKSA